MPVSPEKCRAFFCLIMLSLDGPQWHSLDMFSVTGRHVLTIEECMIKNQGLLAVHLELVRNLEQLCAIYIWHKYKE